VEEWVVKPRELRLKMNTSTKKKVLGSDERKELTMKKKP
jgi:hypothetical protein